MRAVPDLSFARPNPARVYSHFLGGKSWFEVDRVAAEKVLRFLPDAGDVARQNFLFAGRAAAWAARTHGLGQVLDIGPGIVDDVPLPGVEDQVHQVCPDAKVVGCDNDPVVLTHARTRPGYGGVLAGDVTDLDSIFANPALHQVLDVDAPMVVVLAAVAHFVPDDLVGGVLRGLWERVAPGSVLVMSHATSSTEARRVSGVEQVYQSATSQIRLRPEATIRALVDGWEVVDPPGVCDVARWGLPTPHDGQLGEFARVVGLVAVRPDDRGLGLGR